MAYVQPSGIIELFKGINLDNRYMHTIYFPSVSAQTAYFDNLVTAALTFGNTGNLNNMDPTGQMYSRPTQGSVRLHISAESVLGVTYMRFNNRGNKWFYAFVTATEYVNENVTDIFYEIDVMQTWFFQGGDIEPCLVRREHVDDDTFGLNLEAEPVGSEVYDNDELTTTWDTQDLFGAYSCVIFTTEEPISTKTQGIYHGTKWFATNDPDGVKQKISDTLGNWNIQERSAEITDMFMYPTALVPEVPGHSSNHSVQIQHPGTLDQYTPKNNKLFAYPYAYLGLTTKDGDSAMYRWEYFDGDATAGGDIQFNLVSCMLAGGTIAIYPDEYNGINENFDCKVLMDNFPKCSYTIDAYEAWVAAGGKTKLDTQKQFAELKGNNAIHQILANAGLTAASDAISIGTSLTQAATAKKPDQAFSAGLSAARGAVTMTQDLANAMYSYKAAQISLDEALKKIDFKFNDAAYNPNGITGSQSANLAVAQGLLGPHFFHCHVRDDEAKRIDDFFSVFGYNVNRVKKPNLTGRAYWNFVKTEGSTIKGNMPASSKAAIARIFDGGIFLWRSSAELGNFAIHKSHGTIDNPILT